MKEVLDARLPVQVAAPGGEIRPLGGGPIRLTNPADRTALEVALELKALAGGGSRVEAFSVCPRGQEGALVYALARGADAAERIDPPAEPASPLGTVLALHGRFRDAGFDLICCGDETLDGASGCVGPLLAELLGWPQVTSIAVVRGLQEGACTFVRRLDQGHREVVEARLPLVAAFSAEAARPRYVSERRLDLARRAFIAVAASKPDAGAESLPVWPAAERRLPPRARVKKRFAPDSSLPAAERVKAIMSGGSPAQPSSSAPVLEGEASYLVEQVYRFLKHHEFC